MTFTDVILAFETLPGAQVTSDVLPEPMDTTPTASQLQTSRSLVTSSVLQSHTSSLVTSSSGSQFDNPPAPLILRTDPIPKLNCPRFDNHAPLKTHQHPFWQPCPFKNPTTPIWEPTGAYFNNRTYSTTQPCPFWQWSWPCFNNPTAPTSTTMPVWKPSRTLFDNCQLGEPRPFCHHPFSI